MCYVGYSTFFFIPTQHLAKSEREQQIQRIRKWRSPRLKPEMQSIKQTLMSITSQRLILKNKNSLFFLSLTLAEDFAHYTGNEIFIVMQSTTIVTEVMDSPFLPPSISPSETQQNRKVSVCG